MYDLNGVRFGRLVVRGLHTHLPKQILYSCVCDCGGLKVVMRSSLLSGGTQSCGCLWREVALTKCLTHGLSGHPIWSVWRDMRNRCEKPYIPAFKHYGGRGITVCERWQKIENFYADMEPTWVAGLTIERNDVNGNYTPGNCRWVTRKEQTTNRRNNIRVTVNGETLVLKHAALKYGVVAHQTVAQRFRSGWSVEDALFTPNLKNKK